MLQSSVASYCVLLVLQLLMNCRQSGGDELSDVEPIPVFGQENMSVQLPCPHPATPSRVEWVDFVYNKSPRPIRIFDSRNSTNDQHPNSHHYQVSTQCHGPIARNGH